MVCTNIIKSNSDYILCGQVNNKEIEAIYECVNLRIDKKYFFKFMKDNINDHKFLIYTSKD